jgi:bacterioferritin (cytochrome b1)
MSREELIAEQMAIHTCSTLIRWLLRDDPMACKILEEILQEEEARVGMLVVGAVDAVEGAGEVVLHHLAQME